MDRSLLADYELQTFRPLIFSPIYAGTGNPGSALQITAADASGAPLSYATTIVDAGGNWIVQFPVSFWQSSPVGNVADRLSDTMLFNDRDYGIGAALPQASAGQIYAGQLQPTSLVVRYSDPTPFVAGHVIEPPRLTFDGAYSIRTQFFAEPQYVVPIDFNPPPVSHVWNRFAREFAAELQSRSSLP